MELIEIYQPIKNDLVKVREEIKRQLQVGDGFMKKVMEDIIASSGKFLRPTLALLAFSARGDNSKNKDDIIKIASMIELIHTSTLIHDDVIDETTLRRYKMALHTKWGDKISVLFGDCLFSRALIILSQLGYPEIFDALANTINTICEGELRQIGKSYDWNLTEKEYLTIISKKTASLFSFSCFCGAYLGKIGTNQTNALVNYGLNYGIAYQMIDDCLDFIGDERIMGKSLCLDFCKGKVTLPSIYLFNSIPEEEWKKVVGFISSKENNEIVISIRELLQKYHVMSSCFEKIMEYMERAKEETKKIEDMNIRRSLIGICNYTLAKLDGDHCFTSKATSFTSTVTCHSSSEDLPMPLRHPPKW